MHCKILDSMDKELKEYDIPFSGLKPGRYEYSYKVSQDLFGYFGYDDNWSDADIDVTVVLEKRTTLMDLHMQCEGTVLTPCDVTGVEFRLPVNGREELVIKFGDIPSEDEQIIVIPHYETTINIGRFIYEMIVLSVPQKRYHPDYISGKITSPIPYSEDGGLYSGTPAGSAKGKDDADGGNQEDDIDPRWAKLKDIKN